MDMPRLTPFLTALILLALPLPAVAGEQATPRNMTPIDRGFGQGDACFGDKYEKDEDLKTGNELAVEQMLELILGPGS